MEARLLGLKRIMLSMSKRSEYGELLSARLRLARIADALGLPSLEPETGETPVSTHRLWRAITPGAAYN